MAYLPSLKAKQQPIFTYKTSLKADKEVGGCLRVFSFDGVHVERTSCGSKSKKKMFVLHVSFLCHALEDGSNNEHHKKNNL